MDKYEEERIKIEKSNWQNPWKKKTLATVIVSIIIGSICGWWILISNQSEHTTLECKIYLNSEVTEDSWIITVVDIQNDLARGTNLSAKKVRYNFNDVDPNPSSVEVKNWTILNIKHTPSHFNITWKDTNNDDNLNTGEYFIIGKDGGLGGKANINDFFRINYQDIFFSNWIFLPPNDLINTSVENITRGWNINVTWINNKTANDALLGLTFRFENKSGEFSRTNKGTYSVAIKMIESNFSPPDERYRGFYNLTWYDKDDSGMISIGDCFVIDNYSSLIEAGYVFKLIDYIYGYRHIFHNITLN